MKELTMSDNLRQYRAIRDALTQGYPREFTGRVAQHVATLAALISGIVASKNTQLPKVAAHVPASAQPESRVKRFARWLRNDQVTAEIYFVPFAEILLTHLALQTLVLVMDGSVVGRGCVALMIHVIYKGRALPLAWLVRRGKKGHFPEELHIALLKQVHPLLPSGAQVVLLGDGEFDGTTLQRTVQAYGWSYVVRTGSHITVLWDGDRFRCETVGACSKPGTLVALRDVRVTAEAYGPMMLLCCWAKGYKDPLYLLTNMASADEACRVYAKRFRIETFFSDQKSRGFHLHQSHLADPTRLARLLMAACLAYIWIIHLGALCAHDGWGSIIHRRHRCDLSLFQLGLRLLDYLLNEDRTIPVAFYVSIETLKSVR
jgi:Transposase DDE domain